MPTPTNYTFSINTDTLNQKVDSDSLSLEIRNSSISIALDFISTDGDVLIARFRDVLSEQDETILNSIIAAHEGNKVSEPVPTVKIAAETVPTQGFYQTTSIVVPITQSGLNTVDHSWPFPVSLYGATYNVIDGDYGDYIECLVAPDTVVGALTAPTSSGVTVLNVTSTVTDNIAVGFYCNLLDASNGQVYELGRVIGKSSVSGTITVEDAPNLTLSPTGPVYVRMEASMVEHQILPHTAHQIDLGRTLKGASAIPAGTIIRFNYFDANGNSQGKKFIVVLEYFY